MRAKQPSQTAAAPRRRHPLLRALAWALWLLLALGTLALGAAGLLWYWAGSQTSLASTLAQAAQFLPPGQTLETSAVSGSLRSGGRIGRLRWSSPELALEASDLRLRWQLRPLLQGRLVLDELQAARVQIAQPEPAADAAPPTPPTALLLPLQVSLPFRVAQIEWAGPPALQVHKLAGDYRFDGRQHRLQIAALDLAQGHYSASATLDAQAPMALAVTLAGSLRAEIPGGGRALPVSAQATLQGTLATAAAQLQLQARISPAGPDIPGIPDIPAIAASATLPALPALAPAQTQAGSTAPASAAAPTAAARATPSAAPAALTAAPGARAARNGAAQTGAAAAPAQSSPPVAAMQADLQATIAPWAAQPLPAASATLRALDLAALWPQAPVTQLHGTLVAGATPGPGREPLWRMRAQLRNRLPGPWDQRRLPLSALQASASYDGSRWILPGATLEAGGGSVSASGTWNSASAFEGRATLRNLRPGALYGALAADPLSGQISARMQGRALRFDADIRAAARSASSASSTNAGSAAQAVAATAPLRIERFSAQGSWQPAAAQAGPPGSADGTLELQTLLLDALQARVSASGLRVAPGAGSASGQISLSVPGASAQASGAIARAAGAGQLQLQLRDSAGTQRWLAGLPGGVGAAVQRALQGASARGALQLDARWQGGWQTLAQQLDAASAGEQRPARAGAPAFALQAKLSAAQLDLTLPTAGAQSAAAAPPAALALRALQAELSGSLAQAELTLATELHTPAPQAARLALHTRISAGLQAAGQWQAQISQLRLQAQDAQRPGPWALQLSEALTITARTTANSAGAAAAQAPVLTLQTSSGQARLTGPLPGVVALHWQPLRWSSGAGLRLQTQGRLQGLPLAWVDALGLDAARPAAPAAAAAAATPASAAAAATGQPAAAPRSRYQRQALLARLGLASDIVLDGQWNVDGSGAALRASASLRRASGDLRMLADQSAAGPVAALAQAASAARVDSAADVRQAEIRVDAEGDARQPRLRAQLLWASARAGQIDASLSTQLSQSGGALGWPADAPLSARVHARMPDLGLWSALAPPGWRVRGTLQADATLSGTRAAPLWAGTLGADGLAVRSLVDGVDLQDGQFRAALRGKRLEISELRLKGGRGSNAHIAGQSGNRTPAPSDGGTLSGSGSIGWGNEGAASAGGPAGIEMDVQLRAKELQLLVRADRQISISGQMRAQMQDGKLALSGKLTTDRATIILPDETAPSLGADVAVHSAAARQQERAQEPPGVGAQAASARPPEIALTLDLGPDFALQGQGITTRLAGALDIRSSPDPGAPPRVTGELRTDAGRYRAWGQMLDVEAGLIRFNGAYDNPALDILALRPNIAVRAGVQLSGSAQAPRVKLYAEPDLPDAEKLSWVVLGRSASAGGAEAAMLQQAALALLGRNSGDSTASSIASRLGLDEIGFRSTGDDASATALTFGKRISRDLYLTYERSLSGTLGTLYIFYDLSRRLTLRGQTGEKSALDIIYTLQYD